MVWFFWQNFGKTLKTDIENIENEIKNENKNKNKNKNKNSGKKQKETIDSLKKKVNYLNLKKQVFDFLERFKNTTNQFMSDVFNYWGNRVPSRRLHGKQICEKLNAFSLNLGKYDRFTYDQKKRKLELDNCESDLTDKEVEYYSLLETYITCKNYYYNLTLDNRKREGNNEIRDLVQEKYNDELWVEEEGDKEKLKSEISKWVRWEKDRTENLTLMSYLNAAVGKQYQQVKEVKIVLKNEVSRNEVSTSCKEIMDCARELDDDVRDRIILCKDAQKRVRAFVEKIEPLQQKLDTILKDYKHAKLVISQQFENNVMNNTKSVIRKNGK